MKDISLVTVTSSKYFIGTVVMLDSFLHHNRWFKGDLVVIHNAPLIREDFLRRSFQPIQLMPVSDTLKMKLEPICDNNPALLIRRARFYSLETFRLLGYQKVLFCDSDLVFLDDVSELLAESGELICCKDKSTNLGQWRDRTTFRSLLEGSLQNRSQDVLQETFNSGFLLIDGKLLTEHHYNNLLNLLDTNRWPNGRVGHTDQVVLNLYFGGKFKFVSNIYNFLTICAKRIMEEEAIGVKDVKVAHFASPTKPWEFDNGWIDTCSDAVQFYLFKRWHEAFLRVLARTHL